MERPQEWVSRRCYGTTLPDLPNTLGSPNGSFRDPFPEFPL